MRLTVVGCAGSYPNASSPASCYLVEHDGARLVLDLGNGALGALYQYLDPTDPDALLAVAISHCHVDHCVDLASLLVARSYHPSRRLDPQLVLGPSDAPKRLADIHGFPDPGSLASALDVRAYPSEPMTIGPFRIDVTPADHSVEAYSLRVSAGGRSITYSGDTAANPNLVALAEGTDVALFEASFTGRDNPPHLHMSGADAATMAREAGAGRLVLTHLVAHNDDSEVLREARAQFAGPIELARAGWSVAV